MNIPSELHELIQRYLDDREKLSDSDWTSLVELLREHPTATIMLRDQLMVEEALSQKFSLQRGDFLAQVELRRSDFLRGEEELDRQADELREMALGNLGCPLPPPRSSRTLWFSLALALGATALVVSAIQFRVVRAERQVAAVVERVEGAADQAIVKRENDDDIYAATNTQLRNGDRIMVGAETSLTLAYADGTKVRLEENGTLVVASKLNLAGKRLFLDRGVLSAVVAKQPANEPMVFETPFADAVVRGTELKLEVHPAEAILSVVEGKVDFVHHASGKTVSLAAEESASTAGPKLDPPRKLTWPASRERLAFLFSAAKPTSPGASTQWMRKQGRFVPVKLERLENPESPGGQGEITFGSGGYRIDLAGEISLRKPHSLEFAFLAHEQDDRAWRVIGGIEGNDEVHHAALIARGRELGLAFGRVTSSGEAERVLSLGETLEFGRTMHVAVTYDGSQWSAFVNGSRRSLAATQDLPEPRGALRFTFADPAANEHAHWHGTISGVAIYDRTLEESETQRGATALRGASE